MEEEFFDRGMAELELSTCCTMGARGNGALLLCLGSDAYERKVSRLMRAWEEELQGFVVPSGCIVWRKQLLEMNTKTLLRCFVSLFVVL